MGGGGGAFRVYEGFYLRASSQSILNTSKQRILRMKAAFAGFAARAKVKHKSRKPLRIVPAGRQSLDGDRNPRKIISPQCFERYQSAFKQSNQRE